MKENENESAVTMTPPYVSYRTFSNFVLSLREAGIPNRIDRSVPALAGQSGSTQSFLLKTLRFFGFTSGDEGTPTDAFRQFVSAQPAAQKPILAKAIRESYSFIFDGAFKIESATEDQIEEKFKTKGLNGQTVRKALSFFVAICKAADLKLSPHVRAERASGANGTATRKYRRRKAPAEIEQSTPPTKEAGKTFQDKLLDKFPTFDPAWEPELQKQWFAALETFMQAAKKAESGDASQ